MVVEPRVKDYICTTAHPTGCAQNVKNQIAYVKSKGVVKNDNAPKKVLVIGASTGYGLASRIAVAFGYGADTLGVMFEKESNGRHIHHSTIRLRKTHNRGKEGTEHITSVPIQYDNSNLIHVAQILFVYFSSVYETRTNKPVRAGWSAPDDGRSTRLSRHPPSAWEFR